jgi:hypothetical protein
MKAEWTLLLMAGLTAASTGFRIAGAGPATPRPAEANEPGAGEAGFPPKYPDVMCLIFRR